MVDKISHYSADNYRLYRSHLLVAPDDGTYNLIQLPLFTFLKNVWLRVETAYVGGAPTCTLGFIGNGESADADAFMSTATANLAVAGMKVATEGTDKNPFNGKYFDTASGLLTLTMTAGSATTEGNLQVFAEFTVIH